MKLGFIYLWHLKVCGIITVLKDTPILNSSRINIDSTLLLSSLLFFSFVLSVFALLPVSDYAHIGVTV